MTNYLEFNFKIEPLYPWNEILMAELINIGFDSFTEETDGILGYIPKDLFQEENLKNLWLMNHKEVQISYTYQEMPNINWNEEWEKNFSPINVEGKVLIRAEFHEPQNTDYEIIIQPKMSFGTGHHATTYLMIQQMLENRIEELETKNNHADSLTLVEGVSRVETYISIVPHRGSTFGYPRLQAAPRKNEQAPFSLGLH